MKRQNQLLPILSLVLGAAVFLSCGSNNIFSRHGGGGVLGQKEGASTSPESVPETETPDTPDATPTPGPIFASQSWTQPDPVDIPVDLIFVQDTSGSLSAERSAVEQSLIKFLDSLESIGIEDYCLGVLLAHGDAEHGSSTDLAGLLRREVEAKPCICSADPDYRTGQPDGSSIVNKTKIKDHFAMNFTSPPIDDTSDGGEVGLYSFHKSVTDRTPGGAVDVNQLAGCYRPTASLAAIFMSDENDVSTSPDVLGCPGDYLFDPQGPAIVPDDGDWPCHEAVARAAYHSVQRPDDVYETILGAQEVYSEALAFQAGKPFVAAIIGYVDDATRPPATGADENEYPWGYGEFAALSNGYEVDLALATAGQQDAFEQKFEQLGKDVGQSVTTKTEFELAETDICDSSVQVQVDGTNLLPAAFNLVTVGGSKVVRILDPAQAGDPGEIVEITYYYRACP